MPGQPCTRNITVFASDSRCWEAGALMQQNLRQKVTDICAHENAHWRLGYRSCFYLLLVWVEVAIVWWHNY